MELLNNNIVLTTSSKIIKDRSCFYGNLGNLRVNQVKSVGAVVS